LPEKLPSIIIERPKMPRATWEALRAHIMRERLRKKQEQEQNQAVRLRFHSRITKFSNFSINYDLFCFQKFERQKKERENRKKQDAMTLEETKEQIAKLEVQLNKVN